MKASRVFWGGALALCGAAIVACTSILGDFTVGGAATADSGTGGNTDGSNGGDSSQGCFAPKTTCGTSCVDTTSDSNNCGTCGRACGTGFSCTASVCDSAVKMMAAGSDFTCVGLAGGDVYCWGANNAGQIGQSDAGGPIPGAVLIAHDDKNNAFKPFIGFGTGALHGCAVKADGTSDCWGGDFYGQQSDQVFSSDGTDHSDPTPHAASQSPTPFGSPPPSYSYTSLGTGAEAFHQCATTADGGVACWGSNEEGQLGYFDAGSAFVSVPCWNPDDSADDGECGIRPFEIPGIGGAKQVSDGASYTCMVDKNGTVQCWGASGDGERGNGITHLCANCSAPNVVSLPSPALEVSLGGDFTCTAMQDGTAYCWGTNTTGQLGHDPVDAGALGVGDSGVDDCCGVEPGCTNSTPCMAQPVRVPGFATVAQVQSGGVHACALLKDGTVWCWGANGRGQVGNGTTDTGTPLKPTPPTQVSGLTNVAGIAIGDTHSCAFKKDGTAWCWGANDKGQLGNGALNSAVPIEVTGLPLQ